jgi:hypothetical protein
VAFGYSLEKAIVRTAFLLMQEIRNTLGLRNLIPVKETKVPVKRIGKMENLKSDVRNKMEKKQTDYPKKSSGQ